MSNVSTEILSKVIEYMKRMDSDPMPEIEKVCEKVKIKLHF